MQKPNISFEGHVLQFSKYTTLGFFCSLINVGFIFLFVDILKIETLFSVTLVVFSVIIIKFLLYKKFKLLKNNIVAYLLVQFLAALANILFVWLLIDVFNIETVLAASSVIIILFMLRYLAFDKLGLIINPRKGI